MTRQILCLNEDAYSHIRDQLPRAIKSETLYNDTKTADIELSDNVIMKVYEDRFVLDLGMKKINLEKEDFREIIVR